MLKSLNDKYWRAFIKESNQLIYIDINNDEIFLENDIEKEDKEDYKEAKKILDGKKEDNININNNKDKEYINKENLEKNENKDKEEKVNYDKNKDNNNCEKSENKDNENVNYIDPDDLIIIREPLFWEPTNEQILAFAKKLNFDVENYPPKLLEIAKKYLSKSLPIGYMRAFEKKSLQLVYINKNNNDILLNYPYEDEAKKEYEILKKEILSEDDEIIIDKKFLLDNYKYNWKSYKKRIKENYFDEKNNNRENFLKDFEEKKLLLNKNMLKDIYEVNKIKNLKTELEIKYKNNIDNYIKMLFPKLTKEILEDKDINQKENEIYELNLK